MGLLNAALGGILANESFTLSQTYYFGKASSDYEAVEVQGVAIDLRDGLWSPAFPSQAKPESMTFEVATARSERITEAIQKIYSNEAYYQPALSLAAMLCKSGMSKDDAKAMVKSILEAHPNPNGDIDQYIGHVDGFLTGEGFGDAKTDTQVSDKAAELLQPISYQLDHIEAINWVIPGFLPEGLVSIAGEPGIGKTTAIVGMCASAAKIVKYDSITQTPFHRKIIYITEDPKQVISMLYGLSKQGAIDPQLVKERFIVVEAVRSNPQVLAATLQLAADNYYDTYFSDIGDFKIPPLVVIDTSSASIELESENNNSEVSRAFALLKNKVFQNELPLWTVTHTPKAAKGSEGKGLSARGASSQEGDAQTTVYVHGEGFKRLVSLGKKRFTPDYSEIEYTVDTHSEEVTDRYGHKQNVFYSIANLVRSLKSARVAEAKAIAQADRVKAARDAVMEFVSEYDYEGKPLTRTLIQDHKMGFGNSDKKVAIDGLLASGHLAEREVPEHRKQRGPKCLEIILGKEDYF